MTQVMAVPDLLIHRILVSLFAWYNVLYSTQQPSTPSPTYPPLTQPTHLLSDLQKLNLL